MKAPVNLSAREMRRRQRQISAYLSDLRAASAEDEKPRPRRIVGPRAKARAARARRAARTA